MRKSKNRYFYHIFVSPRDAPGAITLNVVWMEREFDAYKLSRRMCPSNYNRFYRAMHMHKRGICRHPVHVRLSVCASVTFVSCAKTNKDIFEIFSPSGSHTILVFPYQTGWHYSDGNTLTGASNVRGMKN